MFHSRFRSRASARPDAGPRGPRAVMTVAARWPWPRYATLAAALSLTACTVGPAAWQPAPQAPADWQQWRSGDASLREAAVLGAQAGATPIEQAAPFQDPVLQALQARVLAANPDLQSAALRFAQARMQRLMSAAQRGPSVGVAGGVSRQRQSETGSATRLVDAVAPPGSRDELVSVLAEPHNVYEAGFDASWELDLWGRVRRTIESADAGVAAAQATQAQARLAVLAELARAYVELRGVQVQADLLQQDLAASQESLDLLQARAAAGLIDDFDVQRQRTLVEDLRARLPDLRAQQARASGAIAQLAGQPPGVLDGLLAAPSGAGGAAVGEAPLSLDAGLPSELALRRPDIQAALARLHGATADVGVAMADLYPRVTLGASFGLETVASRHADDWGSRQWRIGPSLSLPLFDQGRRRAAIELRRLQEQEAAVAYQRTVLDAWHEIDAALANYGAERRRHEALQRKLEASEVADMLARAGYDNGLTDFLPALDARRALIQARGETARSATALAVQRVALRKALGGTGDWAPTRLAPLSQLDTP